ncbi:MAG: plasmid stabilization protein [Acidobacteria bacterium]|nr:plasmid stabilization protein [Acidobacteriota bacterium]
MATLNIQNLPTEVHARPRLRAARANRSMEAEARAILTESCRPEEDARPRESLAEWVNRLYGGQKPSGVVDAFLAERREETGDE